MPLTIAELTSADTSRVPAWAAMRAALWPDEDPAALCEEAERSLAGGACAVLLALDAGRAVGFIELTLRSHAEGCGSSPVGYIEGWYVAPDHRGRGVGRALVRAAERWCLARRCLHIASDTEVSNEPSQAAHRALGFRSLGPIVPFWKPLEPR